MKKIKNFILFTLIFGYAFECYGEQQKKFIDPHAMFDLSDIKNTESFDASRSDENSRLHDTEHKPNDENTVNAAGDFGEAAIKDIPAVVEVSTQTDLKEAFMDKMADMSLRGQCSTECHATGAGEGCLSNVYFKQYVTRLHSILNKFDNPKLDQVTVQLEISVNRHQMTSLKTYSEGTSQRGVQAAHAALTDMVLRVTNTDSLLLHDDGWSLPFTLESNIALGCILVLMVTMLSIFILSSRWSPADATVLLFKLLIIGFIVSVFWNWVHLYRVEQARRLSTTMSGLPEECKPKQTWSWWTAISKKFQLPTDTCAVYHEQLLVDPFWEIPPTRALAVTVSKFFLEPLELVAASVRRCCVALLDGLPFYLWPVILVFVMFMCILLPLVTRGYGVHVPFLFSISLPDRRGTAEIRDLTAQVARLEAQLRHSLAPPESVRPPQLPVNGGGDGIQYSLSTPVIASHQHQQLHQLQSAPAQSSATSRPSVDCSHTHQGRDQQLHRGHSTTCTMCANQATLDTLSADGHSMTPSVSTDGYIVTHSHMTGGRQNVTNSHVTGGGLDDNDEGDSYIVLPSSADSTLADRVSDIGGDRVSQ